MCVVLFYESRACVLRKIIAQPFTNDFVRADIHELIAPDILHQLIKGTFKDHLVTWVEQYLVKKNGKARADVMLSDIDRRLVSVQVFCIAQLRSSFLC